MTRRRSTTVVAAAIAAIAAPALTATTTHAQDAVQWRIEDGGNGHWYRSTSGTTTMGWYESAAEANAVGAHLATVTSSEENAWLFQVLGATTEHIGAFQDTTADDYSEPSGGWRWITGEPWAYQAWNGSGPDNNGLGGPSEEFAHLCCSGAWNDIYPTERFAIFEWSADCNGDGIVDYGQILDGTFADENGNGVPDLCDPVQWRVEDGGNGHWYTFVVEAGLTWEESAARSMARNGHLATPTSAAENSFIYELIEPISGLWNSGQFNGPWIGGYQDPEAPDYSEPDGGWRWITGETWDYTNWEDGPDPQPDDNDGDLSEIHLQYWERDDDTWNDTWVNANVTGYVIEWSADCNGDGIVDYGQILDGTFADENDNGVPDCCDDGDCLPVVQWRIEDGGNGHWYLTVPTSSGILWDEARIASEMRGGHLATVRSESENAIIESTYLPGWSGTDGPWLGGRQESGAPEPGGGWIWITGEPWDFEAWACNNPDNAAGGQNEDRLHYSVDIVCGEPPRPTFNDSVDRPQPGYVVEWSADCNGDGIVDYGQILDGTFADENGNGIPDCCDDGSCLGAVQWKVDEGGNGHWYVVRTGQIGWQAASNLAEAQGGHLATIGSEAENQLIVELRARTDYQSAWIGFRQDPGASEPDGGWGWVTGEPVTYTNWRTSGSEPNNSGGGTGDCDFAEICCGGDEWGDWSGSAPIANYAIEWSADCNDDGIVDYGQILDGTFADCDGNGVPDECDLNAVFAETQPGTPAGPTDYLTFDVSSLPDAQDTVTIEVSALGELAGPARFLFVYINEPTIENRIGILFGGGGANCLGLVETLEMPVGGWNDAGLGGSRSIIIAGSGLDPLCGEDAYTGITVNVPIEFPDCNTDGVWDACTIADGTTPDADGDGTVDDCDQCPTDPEKIDPGVCGCGVADIDTDDDGLADCVDPCPNWPYECSENGQTIVVAADQSIQLAIDVIPVGGTIELAASTYLPPATLDPNGRDFTLRGAVDPEGTPLTVIDGQNNMRILAIDGGETAALLIENLVIRNGYSGGGPEDVGGGVLIFNADATIENCIFEGNTGTNYGGALAIHNDDFVSETTVSNSIFRNNTAVDGAQPSGIGGRGGAISVYRGNPVITSCIFEGNLAQDEGGAIHDNSGAPSVSMCEFDGNTASDDGGALYLFQSTASFVECDFTGSVADYGGGAVFHDGGAPSYQGCTFESNRSTNYYGGGMFNYSSTPTVSECLFVGNTALSGDAGGMYNFNGSDAVLTNCTFRENRSGSGGGIRNNNSSPTLTDCVFEDNEASASGGGIYCDFGSAPTLTGCIFRRNAAEGLGGGMSLDSSSLDLDDCDFSANSAMRGGAISSSGDGSSVVQNCSFQANTSPGDGGAILWDGLIGEVILLQNCNFTENISLGQGGAVHTARTAASIVQCIFQANIAANGGGLACFLGDDDVTVDDCGFTSNVGTQLDNIRGGGAIHAERHASESTGRIDVTQSSFDENQSIWGGAVRILDADATFTECSFVSNGLADTGSGPQSQDGGAFHVRGDSVVLIDDCDATGNGTSGRGGFLIAIYGPEVTISNTSITENDAVSGGGGIALQEVISCKVDSTVICGNIQSVDGQILGDFTDLGGNCISEFCDSDEDGVLECDDACPGEDDILDTDKDGTPDCLDPCPTWPYDCSEDGQTVFVALGQSIQDALYAVPDGGTVDVAAGTFAITDINGLFRTSGDFSIRGATDGEGIPTTILDAGGNGRLMTLTFGQTNATVIENLVLENGARDNAGGAVALNNDTSPTFRNCRFQNNTAGVDGGAVHIIGGSPRFESCRFLANLANEEGGGIYALDASVAFVDCDFDGNTALGGGAIVFEGSTSNEVTNSTFRNNIADRGGAIYLGESGLNLSGSSIVDNVATISGAAITVYQSEVDIDSTIVCGNFPADQISGSYDDLEGNCIADDCGDDLDGNDIPDACDPDCNGDGIPDAYDIATGVDTDANANDIPDACDIAAGDLNVDGCVDAEDLGLILALWGIEGAPVGDLDGDGVVRAGDLGVLLAAWRPCDP